MKFWRQKCAKNALEIDTLCRHICTLRRWFGETDPIILLAQRKVAVKQEAFVIEINL